MNDFKSKLDDLLDELERCCASQHFEVTEDIRAEIHELVENNIHQWHKLIFRPLTLEEKELYPDCTYIVENLPSYCEEVLSEYGRASDEDAIDRNIDVIAWQTFPKPYKKEK
ncbi:MAG: hypothetical protein HXL96_02575 [[Eubacterium] sulci]|nr:hypothetical protein [[Eubacterium] sulci]